MGNEPLNPQAIQKQTFGQTFINGYNTREVDEFLEKIYQDYRLLYEEREQGQEKIAELNREIDELRQEVPPRSDGIVHLGRKLGILFGFQGNDFDLSLGGGFNGQGHPDF